MERKELFYRKAKSSLLQAKKSCIATKKAKKTGMREIPKAGPTVDKVGPIVGKAKQNVATHCPQCGYSKPVDKGYYPAIFQHTTGYRSEGREPGIYGGGCGLGYGCGPFLGGVCPGDESFLGNLCHLLGNCIQVNTKDGKTIVGTLADVGCAFITVAAGSCIAYIRTDDITSIIPQ